MSSRIGEFKERDCDVLGISTDDIETHVRWVTTSPSDGGIGSIKFPLAADPDGTVCSQYGVYVPRQRVALRGLFMIDPNGVLQYQVVHSLSVGRSTDEVLRVLDALQSGGLCSGERQLGEATIDVVSQLNPGRVVGPYKIEAELGKGSFGTVLRAKDTLLDRTVALKVLHDDTQGTDTLLNEARAAAALDHPNVCKVHTVDTSNGASMIVMEFVDGRTLSNLIKEGPLSEDRGVEIARQIATGMASAHETGVIHGDLKPGNIVITPEGTAKIMDFGLARRIVPQNLQEETLPHSQGSTSSGLSGTLGYLAPECAQGADLTPSSDVFALGLIVFEMVTGKRAIEGKDILDVLRSVDGFDATPLIADLPKPLQEPIQSALARNPEERPTMSQLAGALSAS